MRIAVDTGGTFTDCVYLREGKVHVLKVFSTPSNPAEAIIGALRMRVGVARGETIHTENSYKFTATMVDSILQNGGFTRASTWLDPRRWFAVHLARISH
jgi:uncharacterized SAM-dependent methyltransferase